MMKSHSDATHRTLNYVEVIYLTNNTYSNRKFIHYPVAEALDMYMRTLHKLKSEGKNSLVILRDENHFIIKSEKI